MKIPSLKIIKKDHKIRAYHYPTKSIEQCLRYRHMKVINPPP